MSRLLTKAPTSVMIDGVEYPITTDFRDCLFTLEKMHDPYFDDTERIEILINNMYPEDPPNLQEAAEKALWFLRCGEELKDRNQPQLCDFTKDDTYIYSAFLKVGIDLDKVDTMHWWTFIARLSELPESLLTRVIYLRSRHAKGKLTKEERSECQRIGWDVINLSTVANDEFERFLQ